MNETRYTELQVGTTVYLPERTSGNGEVFPATSTVVTEAPWKSMSGIWLCRVAMYPRNTVRADRLRLKMN